MTRRVWLVGEALAVTLVVALLALLVWRVAFDNDQGVSQALDDGEHPTAPAFDLARLDGDGRIDLAAVRGKKPMVIDFWASWCDPCIHESERLQRAHERYGDKVAFVGVDSKDLSSDARSWLRKYGITYASVHDGSGTVLNRWVGKTELPSIFFVDRRGKVVGRLEVEEDLPRFLRQITTS